MMTQFKIHLVIFSNSAKGTAKNHQPEQLYISLIPQIHLCLLILIFSSTTSFSQNVAKQVESRIGGTVFLSLPYSTFDLKAEEQQGIGNGHGFSLGFDLLLHIFIQLGTELGCDFPMDKKKFSNMTNIGELSSSISLWHYNLSAGFKLPDIILSNESNTYLFGNLKFGNMWAFLEKRSIENCIDCDREDLNINGSFYIQPELYRVFDITASGVSYSYFFQPDYKSKLELKIAGVFR